MHAAALDNGRQGAWPRQALTLALIALCVFLAASASLVFSRHGERVTPIWIANAVALAFCVTAAPRRWPAILAAAFAGNLAADLINADPLPVALCLSACNSIEIMICAAIMSRAAGDGFDVTRPRHLLAFLILGGVGAPLVSAILASLSLGLIHGDAVVLNIAVWTLADGVGLLMVTPVLLIMAHARQHLKERPATLRRVAPLALLAIVTTGVFAQTSYPIIFIIPPLWAYAAAEMELVGLAAGAVIVGVISVSFTAAGYGPILLSRGDETHRMLLLQMFIAFSTVTNLRGTAGVIKHRRLIRSTEDLARLAEAAGAEATEHCRRAEMAESISGLGYWRLDVATGKVEWSKQIYTLFGIDPSKAPERGLIVDRIHPDDFPSAQAAFQRCLTTAEPQQYEARVIRPDGALRLVRGLSTAECDAEGQVTAILYVMMDMTDQRRIEAELRQARDQAEQAAVVKAEFLANMSHELRTPLTAILGFTALAEAQGEMPAEVRRYIERIATGSKALLTLVNDVLDFSKLEAGEIRIQPRATAMVDLSREVLDLFADQAGAKDLILRLDGADGTPPTLSVDPDRLRQVLINLLGNAVKFTPQGSVTLALQYEPDTQALLVAVQDTGPGITQDVRRLLFQRFSQIDGSATRNHGGTGLGLAICKGLVEAMGGEIGVDSEPSEGSRFWFRIPAPRMDDAVCVTADVSLGQLNLGDRFLVVDDNKANRDLVRAVLSSMGADIVEASDGAAGVQAALELPFDVILMDLRMPGLSGEDAVAQIRRGGPNANCPIIAFSASADPHQLEDLRRRGFDGALPKPFTLANLMAAIESVLAPVRPERSDTERRHA